MNYFLTPDQIAFEATKRGETIISLCRKAGIHPSTFYRWKGGRFMPSTRTYVMIMNALSDLDKNKLENSNQSNEREERV